MTEYVTTYRGRKAHLRNPENRWATLCRKAVDGIADQEQVARNPHLICIKCRRIRDHRKEMA
jgi:hypothetical protein